MTLRSLAKPLSFLLLAIVTLPRTCVAWGAGHDDIIRAVFERLPEEIRSTFTPAIVKRAVEHGSHYPDSFAPFEAAEIGEDAIAALHAAGVKVRYDLHHDHGRVASFARLVDAFREGDPGHLAHWIASHSHVIADMSACNHDPLVHTATYGWGPWKVKLPHSGDFSQVAPLLDLAGSARSPDGGAGAFAKAIDRTLLADDGRDATKQIHELLLYGHEGARYCSPRGVKILEGASRWIDTGDAEARALLWDQMGELGAWAVVRTLRDVAVAKRFAESETTVELTSAANEAAKAAIGQLMRECALEEDALFSPILRKLQPGDRGAVGVVLEPTWDMNDAMLGFPSRVQSAAIVRTLGKQGRPHTTLDVRKLLTEGFPLPADVPLVVVVATSFHSYHWMKSEVFDAGLTSYLEDGGKVLWIAGTGIPPKTALAPVAAAWKRVEKSNLPVPEKRFVGARLSAALPGDPSWTIVNTPETPAGWQRPHCPWWFEIPSDSSLVPVLSLETSEENLVVGVVSSDRRVAFLPVYSVTPHLLDRETPVTSPSEPELDAPATTLLIGVIDRLLSPR
jgi:hypothetical protein